MVSSIQNHMLNQLKLEIKIYDVIFYTDFGGSCFATNKDPIAICHKNYMKNA
jgi:hypothetical protein